MTEDVELVEAVDGLPDEGGPDVKNDPVDERLEDPETETAAGTEPIDG
jgi:hypothetical protein